MNILTIGNSFSEDATAWLHDIAAGAGVKLHVENLNIGGCPLQLHAENLTSGEAAYRLEINGLFEQAPASLPETLAKLPWDIVTVQQCSPLSGMAASYEPHGTQLLAGIRKYAPTAKIYFHQTWAYEPDSDHPNFADYGCDQQAMYAAILQASGAFCAAHGLHIIPAAPVMQAIRASAAFDRAAGGRSLCRDGFHMSVLTGRYALAAAWFETLTGRSIYESDFVPRHADLKNGYGDIFAEDEITPAQADIIRQAVHRVCSEEG